MPLFKAAAVAAALIALSAAPALANSTVEYSSITDTVSITGTNDPDWVAVDTTPDNELWITTGFEDYEFTLGVTSGQCAYGEDDDGEEDPTQVVCKLPKAVTVSLLGGDDLLSNWPAQGPVGTSVPLTVSGGSGIDTLHGGGGADSIDGGTATDHVFGHGGADKLQGGEGVDDLHGGVGDDELRGGTGNDELFGDEDDDNMFGDVGDDVLHGGANEDQLDGDNTGNSVKGRDQLYGDDGDDYLTSYDKVADITDCGTGGADKFFGDNTLDTYANCEIIAAEIDRDPVVTGTVQVGQTVTPGEVGITGTTLTVVYRWRSCLPGGTACLTHQNSIAPFKIPASAAGRVLSVRVTAANSLPAADRESAFSAVVTPAPVVPPLPPPAAATFGTRKTPKVTATKSTYKIALNQPVTCRAGGAACSVVVTADYKRGKKLAQAATGMATIAAGKTGALTVTFSRSGAKQFKSKRKLALTVRITVQQTGATTVTKTLTFTAKAPKAKKKK